MFEVYSSDEYERIVKILERVLDSTLRGVLKWRPREVRECSYEVDLPSGNIEIGTKDDDGLAPYDFRIYAPSPHYDLLYSISSESRPQLRRELERLCKTAGLESPIAEEVLDGLLSDLGGDLGTSWRG